MHATDHTSAGVEYLEPKITSGHRYCRVWISCVNCLYVQHALPRSTTRHSIASISSWGGSGPRPFALGFFGVGGFFPSPAAASAGADSSARAPRSTSRRSRPRRRQRRSLSSPSSSPCASDSSSARAGLHHPRAPRLRASPPRAPPLRGRRPSAPVSARRGSRQIHPRHLRLRRLRRAAHDVPVPTSRPVGLRDVGLRLGNPRRERLHEQDILRLEVGVDDLLREWR